MAVVTFSLKDLESLAGMKLSEKHLSETVPMMGVPFEGRDDKSVMFEIFPNRPDMLSVEGFARALRSFLGKHTKKISVSKGKVKLGVGRGTSSRPHIQCAVVRNVKITDDAVASLMQIQEKLTETLGRKRKKVAIGIHDFDSVKPPFTYLAIDDPKTLSFLPLDGKSEMNLKEILEKHPKGKAYKEACGGKYLVILDDRGRVLSFPPVINGELTRVTKKTKNLFIDVTGTDEKAVRTSLNILAMSFAERGGKVEAVSINGKQTPQFSPIAMKLDVKYSNKLLGLDLKPPQIKLALKKMGMEMKDNLVSIPPYRYDVIHPMDLVEDIAIGHGYQNFKAEIPPLATEARRLENTEKSSAIKEVMVGLGYQEVLTNVLTTRDREFKKMAVEPVPVPETSNAVSEDCGICRRNLIPSLMNVLSQNMHREYPQKIFELGDCVVLDDSETGSSSKTKLAAAISGVGLGYENLASDLDALMRNLGKKYSLKRSDHSSFIPGRMAKIVVDGEIIGAIGEIHPRVLQNWGLEFPVVALEIDSKGLL